MRHGGNFGRCEGLDRVDGLAEVADLRGGEDIAEVGVEVEVEDYGREGEANVAAEEAGLRLEALG